ncbi:peptidase S8/S53 domain-containing protein [Lasiosphaeria hispida]|uniref:Peptidase S8/S53 domain-containing protein n=1 Tax=Lasiosphaeria hispida TaxID=260671 RepID=A0AAJ0HUR2_9PEZI|nr:peptidase S8/S53 domain-containing protein [Lasiosphaeria hispida]
MASAPASIIPHLSLLSAPKGYEKLNPPGGYSCHPSQGKGVWIVLVDSGAQLDRYPHEFDTNDRTISTWMVPLNVLYHKVHLKDESLRCDDTMNDYRRSALSGMKGHGTTTAILAAGSQSGVAPLANLYLMKQQATVFKVAATGSEVIHEQYFKHQSFVKSLQHVVNLLDQGGLPLGKTVLSLSHGWVEDNLLEPGPSLYDPNFRAEVGEALEKLSKRGVVTVMAAGNRWGDFQNLKTADTFPLSFSTPDNDLIVVGGTDTQGRLWWDSSPGTADCPVDVYAPAYDVLAYDLDHSEGGPVKREGSSYAAPIAAGLAAYFLAHPDYQDGLKYSPTDTKSNSVGMRMKKLLKELAYQRVPDEKKLVQEHLAEYPAEIPESVDVLYNNFHGPQK